MSNYPIQNYPDWMPKSDALAATYGLQDDVDVEDAQCALAGARAAIKRVKDAVIDSDCDCPASGCHVYAIILEDWQQLLKDLGMEGEDE